MATNNNNLCKVCCGQDENEKCVAIFCEEGMKLEMDTILTKHFGSTINLSLDDAICCECWQIVLKFHQLYLKVETNIKKDLIVELNPNDCLIVKNELYENEEVEHKYNKENDKEVHHEVEHVLLDNHHSNDDDDDGADAEGDEEIGEDSGNDKDDDDDDDDEDYDATGDGEDEADEDYTMDNDEEEKVEKPKGKASPKRAKKVKKERKERTMRKSDDNKILEKLSLYYKMYCDICLSPFSSFPDALKHYRNVHSKPGYIICNCDKKYQHLYKIIQHTIWHDNPEAYKCHECNKTFIDTKALRYHVDFTHCPEEERTFRCDLCPKGFKHQHMLSTHIRNQHNCRKYECPTCKQKFILQSTLNSHIKRVHELSDSRICDVCAKFFICSKSYELHYLSNHTNVDQKVQCDECGKWLKHMDILKDHKRRHSAKEEKCELCDKMCANRKTMRAHMLRVHNAPKLKCTVCEKMFKTKKSLKEHVAIHEGLTDLYSCTFCTRTFRSKANMYAHRKRSHPVEYGALNNKS